jgi:hypothetical protein
MGVVRVLRPAVDVVVRAELARQVALLRAPAIHSAVGCAVTPSHKIWRRPAPLPCSGVTSISDVLARVDHAVKGRLLVFFPGRSRDGRYRLLNARESWAMTANTRKKNEPFLSWFKKQVGRVPRGLRGTG